MSECNFADIGDRLPPGDPRGLIAYTYLGTHQDEHDSTLDADTRLVWWKRAATPLEVALLVYVGALDPDDARPITVTNTWTGSVRRPTYAAGRQILTDPRLTPQEDADA